jgi:VanZ family protein
MSAMNDKGSTFRGQSLWLASAWLLVGVVVYLSLARLDVDIPVGGGDKFGHVLAYGVLAFWFMQVYATSASRIAIFAGLIIMGITLEFVQGYVGRQFDYVDIAANTLGVFVGWVLSPPRTPSVLSRLQRI